MGASLSEDQRLYQDQLEAALPTIFTLDKLPENIIHFYKEALILYLTPCDGKLKNSLRICFENFCAQNCEEVYKVYSNYLQENLDVHLETIYVYFDEIEQDVPLLESFVNNYEDKKMANVIFSTGTHVINMFVYHYLGKVYCALTNSHGYTDDTRKIYEYLVLQFSNVRVITPIFPFQLQGHVSGNCAIWCLFFMTIFSFLPEGVFYVNDLFEVFLKNKKESFMLFNLTVFFIMQEESSYNETFQNLLSPYLFSCDSDSLLENPRDHLKESFTVIKSLGLENCRLYTEEECKRKKKSCNYCKKSGCIFKVEVAPIDRVRCQVLSLQQKFTKLNELRFAINTHTHIFSGVLMKVFDYIEKIKPIQAELPDVAVDVDTLPEEKQFAIAVKYLKIYSEKGNRKAQLLLLKLSRKNYTPAFYPLALVYTSGLGVKFSLKRYRKWATRAARTGDLLAIKSLLRHYERIPSREDKLREICEFFNTFDPENKTDSADICEELWLRDIVK